MKTKGQVDNETLRKFFFVKVVKYTINRRYGNLKLLYIWLLIL